MRGSLRMIFKMAWVLINGVMDVFMKENLKMVSHMARGNIPCLMADILKVSLKKGRRQKKVNIFGKMEQNI